MDLHQCGEGPNSRNARLVAVVLQCFVSKTRATAEVKSGSERLMSMVTGAGYKKSDPAGGREALRSAGVNGTRQRKEAFVLRSIRPSACRLHNALHQPTPRALGNCNLHHRSSKRKYTTKDQASQDSRHHQRAGRNIHARQYQQVPHLSSLLEYSPHLTPPPPAL